MVRASPSDEAERTRAARANADYDRVVREHVVTRQADPQYSRWLLALERVENAANPPPTRWWTTASRDSVRRTWLLFLNLLAASVVEAGSGASRGGAPRASDLRAFILSSEHAPVLIAPVLAVLVLGIIAMLAARSLGRA